MGLLERWDRANQRRAEAETRPTPSPYPVSDEAFGEIVRAVLAGEAVRPDLDLRTG